VYLDVGLDSSTNADYFNLSRYFLTETDLPLQDSLDVDEVFWAFRLLFFKSHGNVLVHFKNTLEQLKKFPYTFKNFFGY
jgi:Rad3-related DNA helicase